MRPSKLKVAGGKNRRLDSLKCLLHEALPVLEATRQHATVDKIELGSVNPGRLKVVNEKLDIWRDAIFGLVSL